MSVVPKPARPQLNATLISRQDLHLGLSIVRIRPDQGPVPPFHPGQYVTIGLPDGPGEGTAPKFTRRIYSIASDPAMNDAVELYINLVPGGTLTPRLWSLHEGGRLYLHPVVNGIFTLDDVLPGKDLIMIATGTGISPYLSMLRHFRGKSRWRTFTMIHGVRNVEDLGYRQELEEAAKTDPTIFYLPTVTREDWPGLKGRAQDVLFGGEYTKRVGVTLSPEQCHVFLCGNPAMVEAIENALMVRGFHKHKRGTPGNIHEEAYWREGKNSESDVDA